MNFKTYTIADRPLFYSGLFDCLGPSPLPINTVVTNNRTCKPGNIAYNYYPEQFQIGLLANNNITIGLPWCGRFRVWLACVFELPLGNTIGSGNDQNTVIPGSIPAMTFGLQYNPLVLETIRVSPLYWNINAFGGQVDCVTSPESMIVPVTDMSQNEFCVRSNIYAPCSNSDQNPVCMATFFENPQDTFYQYNALTYGDCNGNTRRFCRMTDSKVCVLRFHANGGHFSTASTFIAECQLHEFDGVFNTLTINRAAIKQWIGGTYTQNISENDPCGNFLGVFNSYQAGITIPPHYGVLAYKFEAYPIESFL